MVEIKQIFTLVKMNNKIKIEYLFQVLFFICLISVEYLATTTRHIEIDIPSWDKLNHFVAFFTLYTLLSLAYKNLSIKLKIILLLIYAFQIEVVQSFIPSRDFSFLDILADFIGIMVGIVFCKQNYIKKSIPKKFFR